MSTRTHYIIYVRPPGSTMWTQHMLTRQNGCLIPARYDAPEKANRAACELVEHSHYCARVVTVELPREADDHLYAVLADGDAIYMPVK